MDLPKQVTSARYRARLDKVLKHLDGSKTALSPAERFQYLERELSLVETRDLDENVALRSPMLAEYLAALFLVNSTRVSDDAWKNFLKRARKEPVRSEPFVRAVAHCCLRVPDVDSNLLSDLRGLGALSAKGPPHLAGRYQVTSGWEVPLTVLPNGMKYRVCELRHVNISAKRARGKYYDLGGMTEKSRLLISERVRRHSSVLSRLENTRNVHQFVDYLEEPATHFGLSKNGLMGGRWTIFFEFK